jgi:hypothetical protein
LRTGTFAPNLAPGDGRGLPRDGSGESPSRVDLSAKTDSSPGCGRAQFCFPRPQTRHHPQMVGKQPPGGGTGQEARGRNHGERGDARDAGAARPRLRAGHHAASPLRRPGAHAGVAQGVPARRIRADRASAGGLGQLRSHAHRVGPAAAVGVRHGSFVVARDLHRLLARPADGDLLPDAPARAGVPRRHPAPDRLRQLEVGGLAPRGLDGAVQPAFPGLRGALPLRGHRRPGALSTIQGSGGGVHQVHPPLVLLRPLVLVAG